MAEVKTKRTGVSVHEFINHFANTEQKRKDSYELIELMQSITGHEPKMWGPSIIGFGCYHYRSDKSRQAGDWPLVGFSPRKAAISLYVYTGNPEHAYLLKNLGKYKMGKVCIYIKKLSDINQEELKKMIGESIRFLRSKYVIKDQ